jgi:beta-glucosidase
MPSYNKVNGQHVVEQSFLLRKVLRDDFGFHGMLMSDWSGTTPGYETIKAGLDLEMPGPSMVRGAAVERDMITGKLTTADVDECVLRVSPTSSRIDGQVLGYVKTAQLSGIPFEALESSIDTPAVRALLRESASDGVVLLKNTANVLPIPLKAGLKIAAIGPNAKIAAYSGGGSASLLPTYKVTPLEAITEEATKIGAQVSYTIGADGSRFSPLLTDFLSLPAGVADAGIVCADFYEEK